MLTYKDGKVQSTSLPALGKCRHFGSAGPQSTSHQLELCWWLQIDGGRTVTEPTCIMTGKPEGKENVSDTLLAFYDLASY